MTELRDRGSSALPPVLLRVRDYQAREVHRVLDRARSHRASGPTRDHLGAVVALLFLQASTRTALSFRSAAYRLGAQVLDGSAGPPTRMDDHYGESLRELLLHLAEYADAIVLRHHEIVAPELVADLAVPVVNAGDAYGEHPTQAMGDLLTLLDVFDGDLDGRRIGILGSTRLRTVHSLLSAVTLVGTPEVLLHRPVGAAEPAQELPFGVRATVLEDLREFLDRCDVVYVSGSDHPDFAEACSPPARGPAEPLLSRSDLEGPGRAAPFLMHPGPSGRDLGEGVFGLEQSLLLQQVRNCLHVRTALLDLLLASRGGHRTAGPPARAAGAGAVGP